jgi:DNA-binding GntR family transcriptional regulator
MKKLSADQTLSRAVNKPELLTMIEDLVISTRCCTRVYISQTVGRDGPQQQHRALLPACKRRDTAKAVMLLERHIMETQAALLIAINTETPS